MERLYAIKTNYQRKSQNGIEVSRKGIGRGVKQGNVFRRLRHLFGLISILITWTLEDFVESSNSMKSRGYFLWGRTAFSIYRFDNRDRGLVIAFFWRQTGVMMVIYGVFDASHGIADGGRAEA